MGKRNVPKGHPVGTDKDAAICPSCNKSWMSPKSSGVPIAELMESHTELCRALRLSGRELLQFVDPNSQSMSRIRKILNAAETLRKEIKSAYLPSGGGLGNERGPRQTPKAQRKARKPAGSEQYIAAASQATGKSKRKHFTRPNSYRILHFPIRLNLED